MHMPSIVSLSAHIMMRYVCICLSTCGCSIHCIRKHLGLDIWWYLSSLLFTCLLVESLPILGVQTHCLSAQELSLSAKQNKTKSSRHSNATSTGGTSWRSICVSQSQLWAHEVQVAWSRWQTWPWQVQALSYATEIPDDPGKFQGFQAEDIFVSTAWWMLWFRWFRWFPWLWDTLSISNEQWGYRSDRVLPSPPKPMVMARMILGRWSWHFDEENWRQPRSKRTKGG